MRAVSFLTLIPLLVACGATGVAADFTSVHAINIDGVREGTTCGSWQESYSNLHKRILSGEQPGRYAVMVPTRSGVSDRLVGIVTVFLYALLTDRAFQIAGPPDIQPLEWVYSQPNINWTITEANTKHWVPGSEQTSGDSWEYHDMINGELHPGATDSVQSQMMRLFEEKPLSSLGADKDIVYLETNRGRSVKILKNPKHMAQLEKLGLTYATAFGCSIEFLFRPLPQMLELIVPEMRRMREPAAFTIGIQIRVGDQLLLTGDDHVDVAQPEIAQFFSCAQQIESSLPRALRHHKVTWLLVSDSASLRKAAAVKFGQKLMTMLDVIPGHSFFHSSDEKSPGQDFSDRDKEAFSFAAAEQYLLSMADAHVITTDSGFGRVAAFMAMTMEGLFFELSLKQTQASCRVGIDHTPLELTAGRHAGIRHM